MKHLFALLLLLPLLASANDEADPADAILGRWDTEGGKSVIEITKAEDGTFNGSIVAIGRPNYPEDDPQGRGGQPRVDEHNPDRSKRDQPLLGLQILSGFTHKRGSKWTGGRVYDPESGKTYRCKMTLDDDQLDVRGYVGVSLLGRTTTWTRHVEEEVETEEAREIETGE